MKYTLLFSLLFTALVSKSQVFWTENFNNGCTTGCQTYAGPNGSWTFASTGTNASGANSWFISCAENGMPAGSCGDGCSAGGSATLHIGATSPTILKDKGAAYNAAKETNMRAESPTINCAGKTSITLAFNYIEDGDGTIDNATVWYYDGSNWSQLSDPAKTPTACAPQGQWTAYSIALPASANNNANVKIGFNWTNNTSGGTDPSFAVDSIQISGAGGGAPVAAFSMTPNDTVCLGQCLVFNDQSTNTPTSWAWDFTGATPATSAIQNPSFICYSAPGTYTAKLTATNGSGSDTETHKIVVLALPHPHITVSGHTMTCTGGPFSAYLWFKSGTSIPTAITATYTATADGFYYVRVTDANGCQGNSDTVTVDDLAVQNVNSFEANVSLYPNPNSGTFTLSGTGFYDNTAWIEVADITGRVVLQEKIDIKNSTINKEIKLSKDIAKGVYMLKLSSGSHKHVLQFRKD